MPIPLEWARHFRTRATECQRLAESVPSLALQDHYTKLAQSYITLAEAEEMIAPRHSRQAESEAAE